MLSEKSLSELADANLVIEVTTSPSKELHPRPAALGLIENAVRATYNALAGTAKVHFGPIAVIQELPERCTTAWFRTSVVADTGAKASSPHRNEATLRFLADGTVAMISWLNASSQPQLADLQLALKVLALGEILKSLPAPIPPKSDALVEAVKAWQHAKDRMLEDESAKILFENGSVELDLTKNISDPALLLRTTQVSNRGAEMILIVEMPDYNGTGSWRLRHGSYQISATIERCALLDEFYRRVIDIRPGDALRCRVEFVTTYGEDLEVVAEQLHIVELLEVLRAPSAVQAGPHASNDRTASEKRIEGTEREVAVFG